MSMCMSVSETVSGAARHARGMGCAVPGLTRDLEAPGEVHQVSRSRVKAGTEKPAAVSRSRLKAGTAQSIDGACQ